MALESVGHRVVTASNGASGVAAAKAERPEVIIVDLLMSPEDGFTACEALRSAPETKHSAILVISAIGPKLHKTFSSTDLGARLDVDGFLEKPVETRALIERVNDMLLLARSRCSRDEGAG